MTIAAVIITYNPDYDRLLEGIQKCIAQVDLIVVVDNSRGNELTYRLHSLTLNKLKLVSLGKNLGIAAAQNIGIDYVREQGIDHVILFDQDSKVPAHLVETLFYALRHLQTSGQRIAAVGPRFVDSRWSEGATRSPFSRFHKGHMIGCRPTDGTPYVPVDFLIASGSLIPIKAIDAIGGMNEELFIDYVDIEWGLRARSAGWALYGVWDTVMDHDLGDDRAIVLGRAIPIHSPLRHYYAIRNAIWLAIHSRLEAKWRWGIGFNGLRRFIAYSLFMPQPLKHIRFMCLGAWHGVRGRMGAK